MTFYTSSLWFRSASSYLANSAITTEHKDRNVMLARRLLIAFALLHTAFAQSSASLVAASSTSSAASVAHTVAVGLTGFVFNPANITANVGDTVVFRFEGQGHTVVKASYGNPCIPYDTIYRGEPSFFSGWFNGTDTLSADPPTWNLTVNDTSPVFYYCSALTSCLDYHMIGVINPNSTETLEGQINSLTSTSIMLQPGQAIPKEGSTSSTSSSTTTSIHHSLSGGAIAGIAIASVLVVVLVGALTWYISRSQALKKSLELSHSSVSDAVQRWNNSFPGSPLPEKSQWELSIVQQDHKTPRPSVGYGYSYQELDSGFEHSARSPNLDRLSGATELMAVDKVHELD